LVQIFEGGKAAELDNIPFLVMEFIPGKSLDKAIKSVPRSAIPSLLKQPADAARYLESVGLVHRDIKPANIVISDDFSQLTLLDLM
jgi:eukaryotic-like serine/threonine-protein kinase